MSDSLAFAPAVYVAVGPYVFGRGRSLEAARKNLRAAGLDSADRSIVYACEDPKAFIDNSGALCTTVDTLFSVVARYDGKRPVGRCPGCGVVLEFSGKCRACPQPATDCPDCGYTMNPGHNC